MNQLSDIVDDSDPGDIFSRESLLIRKNTVPRASTLPRKNSKANLPHYQKPGDIKTITSPTHVSVGGGGGCNDGEVVMMWWKWLWWL